MACHERRRMGVSVPLSAESSRRAWRRAAAPYDPVLSVAERVFPIRQGREWACRQARGEVLEIAIGTGRNLPHYPPEVMRVTGVDVSPEMLAIARRRAATMGGRVALHQADAASLPFPDARFDTVVCTLGLCSIPDPVSAVREALRVCRPGGQLRFFEHGLSSNPAVAWVQRTLEPLTVRFEADRLAQRPDAVLRSAGADILGIRRSTVGVLWRLLAVRGRQPAG
jgi:SAM-dependent methyltransferase